MQPQINDCSIANESAYTHTHIRTYIHKTLRNKEGTNLTDLELLNPMDFLQLDLIYQRIREKKTEFYKGMVKNNVFIGIRSDIN